jgi:hypothetical protein
MLIYKARLGNSMNAGMANDTWIVRGRTFAEVSKKASTTADKKAKEYTHNVWLISLEYLGSEAN